MSPEKKIVWQVKETVPGTKITLKWTACLKELANGHIIVDNCHAGPESPQLFELDQDRNVVWEFNQFELVGNGMACFDYLDAEQTARVRRIVAALREK